ncbi:AAA domain-containing protein [Heracleum sosnowskyi]|uniref:AAA domain-containing protein n=1 Tax=Heracleum sosnowskyi TaxID=360622 RepID=A0AAD8HAK2_9APIA|nr:AAA domain-containing protein [Heracleum sosnowskyi]
MSTMSMNALPSPAAVYAAYASLSSSVMLLRTTFHQIVPRQVQEYVLSLISRFFKNRIPNKENSVLTLMVEKSDEYSYSNYLFQSFQIYMSAKASSTTNRLKINKLSQKSEKLTAKLAQEETISEVYQGVEITWAYLNQHEKEKSDRNKQYWYELRFEKIHKDLVMNSYIPFVLEEAKNMQYASKDIKLHTYGSGSWSSFNLEHSSTFETLAMEPSEKKALMDDLDLFLKRREYFKRVGRAWKRGYLLYGPPGTGKSSLVAAIANYLKFDIYDLQLMNVGSDDVFRKLLQGIANRSILVIEDIDCSVDLPDRTTQAKKPKSKSLKFSLSGLLNFIDGLWSSCGDERIIIFTTNHKDRLDPALLRPGRMDMHIHMSYLTINGFKTLASTYLDIKHEHWRFKEIEELLGIVEVTPAEVAEELMRICDADVCLGALVSFLKEKKKRTGVETKDGEDATWGIKLIPEANEIDSDSV